MLARRLVTFWAYGWSPIAPLAGRPLPQKLVSCCPKGWSPIAVCHIGYALQRFRAVESSPEHDFVVIIFVGGIISRVIHRVVNRT
jgi:hypothetical protein